jgi:hypothetical protein
MLAPFSGNCMQVRTDLGARWAEHGAATPDASYALDDLVAFLEVRTHHRSPDAVAKWLTAGVDAYGLHSTNNFWPFFHELSHSYVAL